MNFDYFSSDNLSGVCWQVKIEIQFSILHKTWIIQSKVSHKLVSLFDWIFNQLKRLPGDIVY